MKMSKRYAKTHFFVGKLNKTDPAKRVEGVLWPRNSVAEHPVALLFGYRRLAEQSFTFLLRSYTKRHEKTPTRPGNRVLRAQL